MSRDSTFMQRVLAGETPTAEHVRAYYVAFHDARERATEQYLGRLHTAQGLTSYDVLAAIVGGCCAGDVLDVGCGDGALLERMAAANAALRLSGVDLSAREIERARRRLPTARVATLAQADATALPFPDASFDVVASHMVFMLIPDVELALREARRVLRAGGTLAFLVGRPDREPGRHAELLAAIVEWIREVHPRFAPVNPADPRMWTQDGLCELLRAAGFSQPPAFEDIVVEGDLDARSLWDVLVQRYYLGSLSRDEEARVRTRAEAWLGGTTLAYREALRVAIVRDR